MQGLLKEDLLLGRAEAQVIDTRHNAVSSCDYT